MSVYCDGVCSREPTPEEFAEDLDKKKIALGQAYHRLTPEEIEAADKAILEFTGYRRCTAEPEEEDDGIYRGP